MGEGRYNALEQKSIAGAVALALRLKPDVIFVPGYYQSAKRIIQEVRRSKGYDKALSVPIVGGDGWNAPNLEADQEPLFVQTYYSTHFWADSDHPTEAQRKFGEAYRLHFGQAPSALAALGYDSIMWWRSRVRHARLQTFDSASVLAALSDQTAGSYEGVSGTITLNDNHNPVNKSVIIVGWDRTAGKRQVKRFRWPARPSPAASAAYQSFFNLGRGPKVDGSE